MSYTVEFGLKTDVRLLEKALKELGFTIQEANDKFYFYHNSNGQSGSFTRQDGKLNMRDGAVTQAIVKKAYSAQVVLSQSARFGWQTKKVGEFEYQITKR